MNTTPIILFTYRRLPKKTIESLLSNNLAKDSELFIFSDGYKNDNDRDDVLNVREYLTTIVGFKSVTININHINKGLANSIIYGVSELLQRYENVIVLEDDLIVSSDFLNYMNTALKFYEEDKKIWSISGYGPNLPCFIYYKEDLYLSHRASSWGWSTWRDRWNSIDWDVKSFNDLKHNKYLRYKFNIGGNDMYKMLELQMLGKIDSWAIRWCFSQFIQDKYTIYPTKSKIINNGFNDGKGTHNNGLNNKLSLKLSDKDIKFKKLYLDDKIIESFKLFHNLSIKTKIGYLLRKYGGYKLIKQMINR